MSMVPSDNRSQQIAQQQPSFGTQLKERADAFQQALPPHITKERFTRVVMTAVQMNPALAKADRKSLWNACMRAANDGLLPDGREGALVIYKTKVKDEDGRDQWVDAVQWLVMIGGLRKKVRQSGEIDDWSAQVVYEADQFDYELGDSPFIKHKPTLDAKPGKIIAAYSIATLKSGEKSREVMSIAQIESVRSRSKQKDKDGNPTGAWKTDYAEMCRKTVARRHSKVLPMTTDVDDIVRREDEQIGPSRMSEPAPVLRMVENPLSDEEPPRPAVNWAEEIELYAGDLGDCEDERALSERIAQDGARFTDAPAEVQADAKKVEAAELARVKRAA